MTIPTRFLCVLTIHLYCTFAEPHPMLDAYHRSEREISELYNVTEPKLFAEVTQSSLPQARKAWLHHTISTRQAKERSYMAQVLLSVALKLRSNTSVTELRKTRTDEVVGENMCEKSKVTCAGYRYRSFDGSCNNVKRPDWAATYSAFQRELPPNYADGSFQRAPTDISGLTEFRVSALDGSALPNPRNVSINVFNVKRGDDTYSNELTSMFPQWAMFVYTDMVHIGSNQLIKGGRHAPIPCCKADHPDCKPIRIDRNDPFYGNFVDCVDYSRTLQATRPSCGFGPREQQNQASGFLDGSVIYGSSEERARKLRTFVNGQLKTSDSQDHQNELPPTIPMSLTDLKCPQSSGGCFFSGSDHINFLPTLLSLHTIFIRHHNNVAKSLKSINPHWNDEQIFQEARRIVIAQIQHITYEEYLPLLVGQESWHGFQLSSSSNWYRNRDSDVYDMNTDPSVSNGFATVAGQFFYAMFPEKIAQLQLDGLKVSDQNINEYVNKARTKLMDDDIEGTLRFMLRESPEPLGLRLPTEFQSKLFKGTTNMGLDLVTLMLHMSRDHGIPSYTVWREACGLGEVGDFEELVPELENGEEVVAQLRDLYKSVRDVDLLVLGLAERAVRGAVLGPTLACVVSKQFKKTKFGDRFWYENTVAPWTFTKDQLNEIKRTTLARIICENSQQLLVQPHLFKAADRKDPVNLEPWRDSEAPVQMPVTMATVEKAIEIGIKVVQDRRKREASNIKKNQGTFVHGDPLLAYGQMMRAKKEARVTSTVSSVLLEATKFLIHNNSFDRDGALGGIRLDSETLQQIMPEFDVSEYVGNIAPFLGVDGSLEKCLPRPLPCDHTAPYRSYTGWCNNLRFPHYGNAFGPLRHIFHPEYDDGIDSPRSRSVTGRKLPLARVVSNAIHVDSPFSDEKFTHMVMQFGQILDHEMTHSPVERGPNDEILNCSRCDSPQTLSVHCMPIPLPDDDPFFPVHGNQGERKCFPMARSLLGQLSLGYRNQLNQLTAYLDGSAIYGSTKCEAANLRTFVGGLLNFTRLGSFNTEALPQGDQEQDCRSSPRFPCFVAGDERNSHQPGLTSLHTVFMREHNRLARELAALNPLWADERLYQETRRLVGALFQHVVYQEYLPKLVGMRFVDRFGLGTRRAGFYRGYDDSCDASISQPFATAAFRFGHTLIRRFFPRMNSFYKNATDPVDLQENYNNVESIYDRGRGGMDSILVGLLGSRCMAFDRHITDAVRNHLFQQRGLPLSGFDLIALNIMRARDHGVQPYNRFREFCGLRRAHAFEDLLDEMDEAAVEALASVYDHVDDIDLFPGLLSERPMGGALMPPTMACLIGEQFQRLKKCDRFYYENDIPETRFSAEQLQEIRSVSLASILCQNSRILTRIQPDVFSIPNGLSNAQVPCDDLPKMSLQPWKDSPVCRIGNTEVPKGGTKQRSPCVSCTCTGAGAVCRAVRVADCRALLRSHLLAEVKADVSCVVQCASTLRRL